MARVIWTEPALNDLDEIAEYIALDKVSAASRLVQSAASRLVQKVFSSTDRLEQFPRSGRKPPDLGKTRYLEVVVNPCRIFYRVSRDEVYILHVMRNERKLRQYLLDERHLSSDPG